MPLPIVAFLICVSVGFQTYLVDCAVSSTVIGSGSVQTQRGEPHSIAWKILKYDTDRPFAEFTITRRNLISSSNRSLVDEWFGFGLGPSKTMIDRDMYFVDYLAGGSCSVTDRYSQEHVNPLMDIELGGTSDVFNIEGTLEPQTDGTFEWHCKFRRLLDTGDRFDFIISDQPLALFWGSGTRDQQGNPRKHQGTVGEVRVNLFSGDQLASPSRIYDLRVWHGALMLISWFILMIPSAFLARYFKAFIHSWFKYHWRFQLTGVLIAVGGFMVALVAMNYRFEFDSIHVVVGLTMLSLLMIQVVLGYLSNALWFEGKPPSWFPDKLHWWIGRLILLGGIFNIPFGVLLYREYAETDFKISMMLVAALTIIIILAFLLLEFGIGQQHEHLLIETDSAVAVEERLLNESDKTEDSETTGNVNALHRPKWSASLVKSTGFALLTTVFLLTVALILTLVLE